MIFTSLFYGLSYGGSNEKPPRKDKFLLEAILWTPSGNSFSYGTPEG
jgi:hypothetical protein